MSSTELQNLLKIGKLKAEPPSATEIAGLVRSGKTRLADAQRKVLGIESRFDLAYNAAHALALAALRRQGYRSDNRYLVFQTLPSTLGLPSAVWRVLAKGHEIRNLLEYSGTAALDEAFVGDLIAAAGRLSAALDEAVAQDLALG